VIIILSLTFLAYFNTLRGLALFCTIYTGPDRVDWNKNNHREAHLPGTRVAWVQYMIFGVKTWLSTLGTM